MLRPVTRQARTPSRAAIRHTLRLILRSLLLPHSQQLWDADFTRYSLRLFYQISAMTRAGCSLDPVECAPLLRRPVFLVLTITLMVPVQAPEGRQLSKRRILFADPALLFDRPLASMSI